MCLRADPQNPVSEKCRHPFPSHSRETRGSEQGPPQQVLGLPPQGASEQMWGAGHRLREGGGTRLAGHRPLRGLMNQVSQ